MKMEAMDFRALQPNIRVENSPVPSSHKKMEKSQNIMISKRGSLRDITDRDCNSHTSSSVKDRCDFLTWQMYHRIVSQRLERRKVKPLGKKRENSLLKKQTHDQRQDLESCLEEGSPDPKRICDDEMVFVLDL